jgi:hypothetical protein
MHGTRSDKISRPLVLKSDHWCFMMMGHALNISESTDVKCLLSRARVQTDHAIGVFLVVDLGSDRAETAGA